MHSIVRGTGTPEVRFLTALTIFFFLVDSLEETALIKTKIPRRFEEDTYRRAFDFYYSKKMMFYKHFALLQIAQ